MGQPHSQSRTTDGPDSELPSDSIAGVVGGGVDPGVDHAFTYTPPPIFGAIIKEWSDG